jgi:hypothetical protein
MNALDLNNGGGYSGRMFFVKLILYIIGAIVVIPAVYTNYLFFQMFFDVSPDNSFAVFLLYAVSFAVDAFKFVALYTFVSICFESKTEEKLYVDLISFFLYLMLSAASIAFQYEGLQHKTFLEVEKVENKKDSTQSIKIDTLQNTGVSVKDRTKHLLATASVLDAAFKNNELKIKTIQDKTTRIEKFKTRLIDKRFFFILFCEFLAVFCCVSIAYLKYKADIEQNESEADGNEDVKKLQAKFRSAVRRGATHLVDKFKKELTDLGAKIPKH